MRSFSSNKLTKRSEFLAVAETGLKWVRPAFILQIRRSSPDEKSRYGITASRKVGGAVERNFAKRRLRALARELLSHSLSQGADYVFIARKGILTQPFSTLMSELENTLKNKKV